MTAPSDLAPPDFAPDVILASTSPTRRALLTAAGVPHSAQSPGVDEEAAKASLSAEGLGPRDMADALAELKALRVSNRKPGLVIGADQTLDLDGATLDKAPTMETARERLLALRGRSHKLHSAVVVASGGEPIWREVVSAKLTMRPFSDEFLDDYMERAGDALTGAAGAYYLEGLGAQLFEKIEGDYFAILGLPLTGLLDLLRRYGVLSL
jgi:septum formation protein